MMLRDPCRLAPVWISEAFAIPLAEISPVAKSGVQHRMGLGQALSGSTCIQLHVHASFAVLLTVFAWSCALRAAEHVEVLTATQT